MAVPVIDVFAGPGGLGEGFSACRAADGSPVYSLALSVEKDETACQTLRMRCIRRQLSQSGDLEIYFDFLRGGLTRQEFFADPRVQDASARAHTEVQCAELGRFDHNALDRRVANALAGAETWVLIGGPPCQAYSLAGRARRTNDERFEEDERHFLYREYLRLLRRHAPPVFVMENVKGLLSSRHRGQSMFAKILRDLSQPSRGLSYDIRPAAPGGSDLLPAPNDFLIESERHGVPQARHRVILVGVRSDLAGAPRASIPTSVRTVTVSEALAGLPRLRSRLSREPDSHASWLAALGEAKSLVRGWGDPAEREVLQAMSSAVTNAGWIEETGGPFVRASNPSASLPMHLRNWLHVPALGGVIQHEARPHMRTDLARYLFAASYAGLQGRTPKLDIWPERLLPSHDSARGGGDMPFKDRFRVQCENLPSSTIVSHISKDGHYYIHPDPEQCRSLTVREAARLQTFPDDYLFEGNRTQQYVQVGNAVPPLLAFKIAELVRDLVGVVGQQQMVCNRSVTDPLEA